MEQKKKTTRDIVYYVPMRVERGAPIGEPKGIIGVIYVFDSHDAMRKKYPNLAGYEYIAVTPIPQETIQSDSNT